MEKCVSCGKVFDYEKYHGICPGCGAYHKKAMQIIPKSEQERLDLKYGAPASVNNERAKKPASHASLIVFIGILTGLVLAVTVPFCYIFTEGMKLALSRPALEEYMEGYGPGDPDGTWADGESQAEDWKVKEIPQNPELVTLHAGESFLAGVRKQCTMQVNRAFVAAAAGTDMALPAGKNLVAVEVSYDTAKVEASEDYDFSDVPYIEQADSFWQCLESWDAVQYIGVLDESMNILDIGTIQEDRNGTGVFLVFVPVGVTEITFSIESRDERTNDIQRIYQVPLELEAGEGV